MGCIPSTLAGVVRGSVLFLVGVLTDSHDTRHLGKQVMTGMEQPEEYKTPHEEVAEFESMRRELDQWKEDLERCKEEGSTAGVAKIQQLMEKREKELRLMEARHRKFEQEARNYPPPPFMQSDGWEGTLNIALAGCSGVGKSLLINSLRGVKYGDHTHAPVGTKHTTIAPKMYEFPGEPLVRLWDLPGAGSKAFPRDTYPREVGLRHFDVVLLVFGCRFTQTDAEIFRGLCEQGVPTLVVRTMIDLDIANGQKDSELSPEQTLKHITDDLKRKGIFHPYLVNARRPTEHDFPRMSNDLQKALVVARGSPRRGMSWMGMEEDQSPPPPAGPPGTDLFKAGDEAEVVVLKGSEAGSWAKCVIMGPGTQPGCYTIALPDAPPEQCTIPNVHISTLRSRASAMMLAGEKLIDLETVKEILTAFKAVSSRNDIQATLAAIDKQGPVTAGVRRIKHKFIADTLRPALSKTDIPIPKELSPLLIECIQSYQSDAEVRNSAQEVEAMLNLSAGELFGIVPQVNGNVTGFPIRDASRMFREWSQSWWIFWLFFGCGFFDLITFATFPGALLQPFLLVLRMYAHFRRSRMASATALEKYSVLAFHALGTTLACMVACLLVQRYGQDGSSLLPSSATAPSTLVARTAIEKMGAVGVAAQIMIGGSSSSLPAVLYASRLGCRTIFLMVMCFLASAVKLALDLEILLGARLWLLRILPFVAVDAKMQGGWQVPSADALVQRLADGKAAVEQYVSSKRELCKRILFGLQLICTISLVCQSTVAYVAVAFKFALHYLLTVQETPSKESPMMAIPLVDGTAVAVGVLLVQLVGRWRGQQAVAHLLPETGWEFVKGAVASYGSFGIGVGTVLGASSSTDPMMAASAATSGCSILLAPAALFAAVALRSVMILEGGVAVVSGLVELSTPVEDKDE